MIKIGIVGYGNLGKSVEKAINASPDMELIAIFSRRNLDHKKYVGLKDIRSFKEKIDLLILCGSSDKDILDQAPRLLKDFNTLDSFDNHGKIKEYYKSMDKIGKENGKLALISTGWDPGLFSLQRIITSSILAQGSTFTLWGKGVSQGHSAAVRSIDGVVDATQYTIPKEEILDSLRNGERLDFDSKSAHIREVYVSAKEDADKDSIRKQIVEMPDYFDGYETKVYFISQEELERDHKSMIHGGHVLRIGEASGQSKAMMEFSLKIKNNPDFTAACDIAYARALYRLRQDGRTGAITILDVPPAYLSSNSYDELLNLI